MQIYCPQCNSEFFNLCEGDYETRAFCLACDYDLDYIPNEVANEMIANYEKNKAQLDEKH